MPKYKKINNPREFIPILWCVSTIISFNLISIVHGDIPAHCTQDKIVGKWISHYGNWNSRCSDYDGNIIYDQYCGYKSPDNLYNHGPQNPPNVSTNFEESGTQQFELFDDGIVKWDDNTQGRWTMIHDQAIGISRYLKDSVEWLISYWKYTLDINSPIAYTYCNYMQVGFRRQKHKSQEIITGGCFWAEKHNTISLPTNAIPITRPTSIDLDPEERIVHINMIKNKLSESNISNNPDKFKLLAVLLSDPVKKRIAIDLLPQSLNHGILTPNSNIRSIKRHDSINLSFSNVLSSIRSFSWDNPDDVMIRIGSRKNVIPLFLDQGQCGSCYSMVVSAMVTSRLRIKYHQDQVADQMEASEYLLRQCSPFNQGCNGGFGWLALAQLYEKGIRTKQCLVESIEKMGGHKHEEVCQVLGEYPGPATTGCHSPNSMPIELPESCSYEIRVIDFGYTGGQYGKSNEDNMMAYLWSKGPLLVSLEPTDKFTHDNDGLFLSNGEFLSQGQNVTSSVWQQADHAMLLVGWGWNMSNGKYYPTWRVYNTWGPKWNKDGTINIIRGTNSMAIEHAAVFADISLYRNGIEVIPNSIY